MSKQFLINIGFIVLWIGVPLAAADMVDVDKLHDGVGGWADNWYDDFSGEGEHDPGEPFADTAPPWWVNPAHKNDLSCWLASACNQLQQAELVPNGFDAYLDYAFGGVGEGDDALTWDDGGYQHYAINWWAENHPDTPYQLETHQVEDQGGLFLWDSDPRDLVADYLAAGWQVGIGMKEIAPGGIGHLPGGHCITIQELIEEGGFYCTDSDRDWDHFFAADVNAYFDAVIEWEEQGTGVITYQWVNDYYAFGAFTGDVDYICALIPEPHTLVVLVLGAPLLLLRRRR